MRLLVCLSITAIAATLAAPDPAEACSPPLAVFVDEPDLAQGIDEVPADGPLVLLAFNEPTFASPEELDMVRFTVVDSDGIELAGTTEITESRVLWRPAAPLDPLTQYSASLDQGWFGPVLDFTFTTGDEFTPDAAPDAHRLAEEARAVSRTCCEDDAIGSCGPFCYARDVTVHPVLRLHFTDRQLLRYQDVSVTSAGEVESFRYNSNISVVFASGASYCAEVTATSIVDGSQSTTEVCADPGELVALSELPEPPTCNGTEIDEETGAELSSGGCSSSGSGGGTGALLLALCAIAAIRASRAGRRG